MHYHSLILRCPPFPLCEHLWNLDSFYNLDTQFLMVYFTLQCFPMVPKIMVHLNKLQHFRFDKIWHCKVWEIADFTKTLLDYFFFLLANARNYLQAPGAEYLSINSKYLHTVLVKTRKAQSIKWRKLTLKWSSS